MFSLEELKKRIRIQREMNLEYQPEGKPPDCLLCLDVGYLADGKPAFDGRTGQVVEPCVCQGSKRMAHKIQSALIPAKWIHATLENYKVVLPHEKMLHAAAMNYIKHFSELRKSLHHSLGFVAIQGESDLMKIENKKLRELEMKKYNSWGLGKTHLMMALAKELLAREWDVFVVTDNRLMDELSRKRNEDTKQFEKMLNRLITAEILIWDDLGKSKDSEFNHRQYYTVIDARERMKKPILYTSNESVSSLQTKLSPAVSSRLIGMTHEVVEVKGPDWRLK